MKNLKSLNRIDKYFIHKKKILTLEEAAIYTGFSKSYLYKLTHLRKIPHSKPNGKLIRFNKEELEEWLGKNKIKTIEEIEKEAISHNTKNERRRI